MKTRKKLLVGGAMLAFSAVSYGQFTLSGEIRPRMEYRHGYKTLADTNQADASYVDQRSRLNFDYKEEGYQVRLVMQDVRTWGANSQLNTSDAFSSIHEAWGQAFITDNWSLKMGRQEIIYDDHRIFGSVAWLQQARSHDAIMVKYQKDGMKLDITGAYNQDSPQMMTTSYTVPKSYKAFQSIWFHKDFSDNLKMSLLFLNNGQQVNWTDTLGNSQHHDNYTQTIGTHTKYKKDKLSVAFNGFYQMGPTTELSYVDNGAAKSVGAYLVGLDLGYKVNDNFSATLGFEMQSGQSQTDTTFDNRDVNNAFTPFYGTNHKFNGLMDYFYVGSGHDNVGLRDIYAKVKYKKGKSFVGLNFHMFGAMGDVNDEYKVQSEQTAAYDAIIDGGGTVADATTAYGDVDQYQEMDKNLGMEFDLSFGTQLSKGVTLKGGFSMMMATETLAELKGVRYGANGPNYATDALGGSGIGQGRVDQMNTWGYVMVIFKPTFLKVDKKKEEKK